MSSGLRARLHILGQGWQYGPPPKKNAGSRHFRKLGRRPHQELKRLGQGPTHCDTSIEWNSRRADSMPVHLITCSANWLPVALRINSSIVMNCRTLHYITT